MSNRSNWWMNFMMNSYDDKMTVRYQSWRRTTGVSRRQLALGSISLVILFSASLYISLVYQSVTKPLPRVLIVGPTIKAASIHPEDDSWIDLPRVFSAASAARSVQGLSSHPNSTYEHVVSPEQILKELKKGSYRGSPLLVYYSGVISVASDKVAVLDSSKQAGMPTHASDICQLIEAIKNCDASVCIIVFDLSMPDLPGPLSLAASHAFDQARIQIDSALRIKGNVPTAIQLSINRIPRWHEITLPSEFAWENSILPKQSECSSQFITAVETFSKLKHAEIHALQELLSKRASNEQKRVVYQAQTEWLCSPDWPLNDRLIYFSEWHKPSVVGEKSPSNEDAIAGNLTPNVLIRKSLENYQNLLKQARERNVDQSLPWISTPAAESYAALQPAAYSLLEKNYYFLRTAYELSPDALNHEGVQSIVESLHDAWNAKPLPDRVPKWLTSYFMDKIDSQGSQVYSIVSRAVLSSYGLATPLKKSEIEWLAKLQSCLDSSDPVNKPLHRELVELSADQQPDFFEYRWIDAVISREGLDATILNELIRAKLMELRMTSDPFIVQQFGSKLLEATRQLIAAERLLFDKNELDWHKKGLQSLKHVQSQFDACFADFLEFRRQQNKSIDWYYGEVVKLEHFSFPAPQLEPDGGVASDEEVLKRYKSVWAEFHFKSRDTEWNQATENAEETDWQSGNSFSTGTKTKLDFVSQAMTMYQQMGEALNRDYSTDMSGQTGSNAVQPPSLLLAKHEFLNECNLHSFDPRKLITALGCFHLKRITDAAHGAQTWEADLLALSSASWHKIATQLAPQRNFNGIADSFSNSIRIDAPLKLDFSSKDKVDGVIGLQLDSAEHTQATITSEYDESRLQLDVGGKTLAKGASLPLEIQDGKLRPTSLPISVRKLKGSGESSPVIFYVSHGGQKRRAVLESEMPLPPMLSIVLQNKTLESDEITPDFPNSSGTILERAITANKHNQIVIATKHLDFREAMISHRILLNQSARAFPMHGVLDQSRAIQAIHSFGPMPVAAIAIPRLYKPGQSETVALLPDANFATLSDTSFRELVLESTNETTKQVQYTIIKTKAINPRQFIHATVVHHSDSQMMEVAFSSTRQGGFPVAGVTAQCELWDLGSGRLLATPQCVLDSSPRQKSIRISTAAAASKNLLINIAIDNWKSVFVFEIDRDRSGIYEPDTSFVGATLRVAQDSNVIKTEATHVQIEMDLCINESTFETNRDWIHVGIDQNLDRTLDGETVVEVRDTKTHQTKFHGVSAEGEMILESRIGSIQALVPIEFEWNRRGTVLAKIVRSGETIYSNGPELIFDKRKPEIRSAKLSSVGPVILGKPLEIEVITDDANLSGVELVEGGWSVTGEAEFHDRMTIVPALSNQSNRWLVTLPTATILPGYNTLLIRARDRAGNLSKTYTLPVLVLTEAEHQKQLNAAVTIIRGRLIADYKLMPGAKLTLGIEAEPNSEKQSDPPLSSAEPKVIATAMADENGSFLFTGIPSGKYILESNVILRGTRIVQRTPIVVDALVGPADCSITVDRQK
jgi:hypothetical protein